MLAVTAAALVATPVAAQASPHSSGPIKLLTQGKVASLVGSPIAPVDRTPNFGVGQYFIAGPPSYSPPGFNCDPATVITGADANKHATYVASNQYAGLDVRVLERVPTDTAARPLRPTQSSPRVPGPLGAQPAPNSKHLVRRLRTTSGGVPNDAFGLAMATGLAQAALNRA